MDVLITSQPEKLSPEVRALQDPARPLPGGTRFFEEKFVFGGLVKQLGLGIALIAVGVPVLLFAIVVMFSPSNTTVYSDTSQYDVWLAVIGLVLVLGGYIFISTLKSKYRVMKQQQKGIASRYGVFLSGDLLIGNNSFDTTIIPRSRFKGVQAGAVQYEVNGAVKSFNLPEEIVGADRGALESAIRAWAGG